MVEIFDLQTNIAEKVASALDITLLEPEREILNKKHTINLEAYDYYLRGNEYLQRGTKEKNFKEASMWYLRAVELDPGFALAYAPRPLHLAVQGIGLMEEAHPEAIQ